jgi:putative thioredoxin
LANLKDYGDDPLEASLWNSVKLARKGNFPAALDGLLGLLRVNKNYMQGSVKQIILAILEVMGDAHPDTRQYRAELASILF